MEVRGREGKIKAKLVRSKENKTKNGNETKIKGEGEISPSKSKESIKSEN
ncbi:hypothetical protein [Methanosarcina siciliae]|nr:hypothetical protein [Methanosarcina siciliae]